MSSKDLCQEFLGMVEGIDSGILGKERWGRGGYTDKQTPGNNECITAQGDNMQAPSRWISESIWSPLPRSLGCVLFNHLLHLADQQPILRQPILPRREMVKQGLGSIVRVPNTGIITV